MKTALFLSSGVIVWALHFAAIYGFTALACARGSGALVVPAIAALSGVAVVAALAIVVAGLRRRHEFEGWLAAALAGFALLAIVYESLPAAIVPVCG